MNNVSIIGRLTKDPELMTFDSGKKKCSLRLAVDRRFTKDPDKKSFFISVDCWGSQAENVAKYKKVGESVAVTGRIDHREWTSNDGSGRDTYFIVADNVDFIGPRSQEKNTNREVEDILA